jgi:hypothetical protein
MEAKLQPNVSLMGIVNRVQPYCRLAIITMQMMPTTSCAHRVRSEVLSPAVDCDCGKLVIRHSFLDT